MRPLQQWFDNYSQDHRNPTNQLIHWICVPAILWTVLALLWCIPSPGTWFRPGFWAAAAMVPSLLFYYKGSRMIGLAMLLVFALLGIFTSFLYFRIGPRNLALAAAVVFALAWIGQFIGHKIEGRKPSFITDLTYLLIGPAWLMSKVFRRFGWSY